MSEQSERKRVILSGIQPTGTFTLGNYIGAVRNWAKLQDQFNCLYMVADLHALTVRQDPAALRRNTREAAAMLLAAGIDPAQSILFVQSHVPAHTQLNWILCCNAQFGELSRMTQFKDKSAKHPDNVNGGLFTYPALMAADILIYNADLVPVGQDQTQHLELARNVAQRFNNAYSPTFTLPEGYVTKEGAKIMSLADPTHKMSKSDTNVNAFILLTDDRDTITRKFKRAVTDSDGVVRYDYGVFKEAVGAAVADGLAPIQGEYARILADKAYVDGVLKEGAAAASRIADRMIQKVYRKVGLLQL